MVLALVEVVGMLAGLGADWAVWRLHNQVCPVTGLALDTDLPVPVGRALPGFLFHPAATIR